MLVPRELLRRVIVAITASRESRVLLPDPFGLAPEVVSASASASASDDVQQTCRTIENTIPQNVINGWSAGG